MPLSLPVNSNKSNLWAQAAAVLCQPGMVFLPLLTIGVVLWLCPSTEGASGYRVREELTFGSILVLAAWYGGIFVCAALGQYVASVLPKMNVMSADAFRPQTFYLVLSMLAIVGVAGAWLAAMRGGPGLLELIRTQQFNQLKDTLYENYNHLYSLRYAASLVGGYALYRLVFLGKFGWLDAINFCLLLAAAALSARLLIAQAVLFAGGLAVRFDQLRHVSTRAITLAVLGLSALVITFTWVRTAGSYREYFGVENPIAVTFLEVQRYVGAPVQASVGVARIALDHPARGANRNVIKYVTPTFMHPADLRPDDNSGGVGQQWYLRNVDVEETLTTNSAFVEMYGDLGYLSFPLMAWIAFSMSAVGSYFFRAENLLCLIGCVVLYGFFELWRTYYFAAGSFTFLILAVLLAVVGTRLVQMLESPAMESPA